jgi:hypothetical protein
VHVSLRLVNPKLVNLRLANPEHHAVRPHHRAVIVTGQRKPIQVLLHDAHAQEIDVQAADIGAKSKFLI